MNLTLFIHAFSKAIRENRIALGITQSELAIKSNVSLATIKRIESGATCGLKEYARILAVLNPMAVERVFQALAFNPLDFTQDAIKGIHLLNAVKEVRRVRSPNE